VTGTAREPALHSRHTRAGIRATPCARCRYNQELWKSASASLLSIGQRPHVTHFLVCHTSKRTIFREPCGCDNIATLRHRQHGSTKPAKEMERPGASPGQTDATSRDRVRVPVTSAKTATPTPSSIAPTASKSVGIGKTWLMHDHATPVRGFPTNKKTVRFSDLI